MQCPASHGSKTKPFAQITSLPSLFNGPDGAAIRANGLRDECVNDYSAGVGSSPSQVDYACSFPLSLLPLFLFLCLLSVIHPLTVLHPFYSTDPRLTHVSQHATDLCGTLPPPNLLDQAVRHITGRSLSTLWSKLFTASSTWWTISRHDPILLFYSKQCAS